MDGVHLAGEELEAAAEVALLADQVVALVQGLAVTVFQRLRKEYVYSLQRQLIRDHVYSRYVLQLP